MLINPLRDGRALLASPVWMSSNIYSRRGALEQQFNDFFKESLNVAEAYRLLSGDQILQLKRLLSNIHNLLTLEATVAFVRLLETDGVLSHEQAAGLLRAIDAQHANTNGYDVRSEEPCLIAEVKCMLPCEGRNKDRFGAAQREGLWKDLTALSGGKKKAGDLDVATYAKYMVVLSAPNVKAAMDEVIARWNQDPSNLPIKEYDKSLNPGVIQVVYVSLDRLGTL